MFHITPEQLATAFPTALFGIFALWAASSKRHWFLRTAVVGAALVAPLLVEAYEVVIQFGCVVLTALLAIAFWRRRRHQQQSDDVTIERSNPRLLRVSMATLMLVVVVVAVVTAVAARVPQWPLHKWVDLVGSALMGGAVVIACVWIVYGRAHRRVRLLATPLLLVSFVLATYILGQVPHVIRDWANEKYQPFTHYVEAAWKYAAWGITFWSPTIGIGMAIMIAWLLVVRRADWFDPFGEKVIVCDQLGNRDGGTAAARLVAMAFFILIALIPLTILYRLALPPPIPAVKIPEPNGWDDLMAAGAIIGPEDKGKLIQWMRTKDPLPPKLYKAEAITLMRRGLSNASVNPYSYRKWNPADVRTIFPAICCGECICDSGNTR